jgi:hypothetical protein
MHKKLQNQQRHDKAKEDRRQSITQPGVAADAQATG